MSLDLISYAETRNAQGEWEIVGKEGVLPFIDKVYAEFFCGLHELAMLNPIDYDRGLPSDASEPIRQAYKTWAGDALFASWLTVQELLDFDYSQTFACHYYQYQPSTPVQTTYRDYLPSFDDFMDYLNRMKEKGVHRIVFWYVN